jgi:hypothetical protein
MKASIICDHISLIPSYNENISDEIVEKMETHILCSITFFLENCAVYEKMWNEIW